MAAGTSLATHSHCETGSECASSHRTLCVASTLTAVQSVSPNPGTRMVKVARGEMQDRIQKQCKSLTLLATCTSFPRSLSRVAVALLAIDFAGLQIGAGTCARLNLRFRVAFRADHPEPLQLSLQRRNGCAKVFCSTGVAWTWRYAHAPQFGVATSPRRLLFSYFLRS